MKNLLYELKKCSENKYSAKFTIAPTHCRADGKLKQMILLEQIEALSKEPVACLRKVAPNYNKDLQHVDLQIFNDAFKGDELILEAKFYEVNKRTVALKIFVRKVRPDKSTKRICRAMYQFKAIFEENDAA